MYVLKRTDQGGGYVAKEGHSKSYTFKTKYMRTYNTEKDAIRDSCIENEIPVHVSMLF
jgi:hypothetical protein